ncbi:MAG: hypothetical protein J3K34DRAFT_93552 [Monoraphidium minutum]|nr:MAG: hypothetical protein J3K34DRAFT_93552 [Monoraphidium minutum]
MAVAGALIGALTAGLMVARSSVGPRRGQGSSIGSTSFHCHPPGLSTGRGRAPWALPRTTTARPSDRAVPMTRIMVVEQLCVPRHPGIRPGGQSVSRGAVQVVQAGGNQGPVHLSRARTLIPPVWCPPRRAPSQARTPMQQRVGAALTAVLLILPLLAATARACGGHGEDEVSPWDREIEVKGRRRSLLSLKGRRCGAVHPSPEVLQRVEFRAAAHRAKESARAARGKAGEARVYKIPTYVFNVVGPDGRGAVAEGVLRAQVDALNEAYATAVTPEMTDSTAAEQAGLRWAFELVEVVTVKAGDMCDAAVEKAVKAEHRKGGKGALNLYITDLSTCGLLGYSSWPWELDPKAGKADAETLDGVVIHHETLPGGGYKPYNMGRTCIHETGHWMGLYHVFQNGCSKGGDQVDDTPYQSSPTEGCPKSRDSCPQPGEDPFWNFMDYTDDKCMRGFTPLQHKRMETMWQLHREG